MQANLAFFLDAITRIACVSCCRFEFHPCFRLVSFFGLLRVAWRVSGISLICLISAIEAPRDAWKRIGHERLVALARSIWSAWALVAVLDRLIDAVGRIRALPLGRWMRKFCRGEAALMSVEARGVSSVARAHAFDASRPGHRRRGTKRDTRRPHTARMRLSLQQRGRCRCDAAHRAECGDSAG